jgi:siroheme synthase (precorrin-2 oxidase/ferrochelatase)
MLMVIDQVVLMKFVCAAAIQEAKVQFGIATEDTGAI